MFDHLDARDELSGAIAHRRSLIDANTARLLAALRLDLRCGPVHCWQDGEPQLWGCADPLRPSRPFDVAAVCASVRDRLDALGVLDDVTMCVCVGEDEDGEPVDDWIEIADGRDVLNAIAGPELAAMICR